jgi:DNA (cytosine-5)-methyltransferase 1
MNTHIDLFSGIGGFALAARWAGVKTIGFAEIDSYASRVLAKNFPGITNYGDIKNVPAIDNVWLVTGGFPCQPFSVAGKRAGTNDDRWLWPEMAEVIERVNPNWVLAENVPGIVSMELDTVLADLERLNYSSWPIIIPAVGVNAPHRRDRVWIVANARCKCREKIWTESTTNQSTKTIYNKRCDQIMANANSTRLEGRSEHRYDTTQWSVGTSGRTVPAIWESEPQLGRVAHGIPHRVDRLRGLGNAIVPQVAYQIISMMLDTDAAQLPRERD